MLVHLNEGHAAFAVLELARAEAARGAPVEAALEAARQRTVFTTHTPVAAGNETYPREELTGTVGDLIAELGVDPEALLRLGRHHPEDPGEPFGITQFSLRMSRAANGVSRRHGGVAREMWHGLWPERALEGVPIAHVTNGVHLPSWVGAPIRELLERYIGQDWWRHASDIATWEALDAVPDTDSGARDASSAPNWSRSSNSAAGSTGSPSINHAPGSKPPPARLTPTCSRSGSRDATPPTNASGSSATPPTERSRC